MASQLRRSGWALLHVALALAIALLTLPVFGSGASAEEVAPVVETTAQNTTTQDTGTSGEQTDPAPAAEEAAPAFDEPAPAAEAPAPEVATTVEDPAPEPEGVEVVGSTAQKPSAVERRTPPDSQTAVVDAAPVQTEGVAGVCDTNRSTGKVDAFLQNTSPDRSGEWANGNMNEVKADLAEGEVVPQRVDLINLQPGENELVFTYDVYLTDKDVKKWAYDYVGNYSMTNDVAVTGWVVKNGDGPVATVEVTFDVPAGATSSMLYFDAHIASELDHGPGSGAGSINGSPYHVSLSSLNCASSGAQDNQIMASAIDAGELTVIKDAIPADGTDFRFGITPGGDSSTFYLDDDGDAALPDRVTYRVPPGSYTVTETDLPAGWNLTGVVCSKVPSGSTATSRTVAVVRRREGQLHLHQREDRLQGPDRHEDRHPVVRP